MIATSQFGDQALELVGARELLVPTMKLLAGAEGPVSIDHFACYDAIGAPLDLPISIRDQFHEAGSRYRRDVATHGALPAAGSRTSGRRTGSDPGLPARGS